MIFAKFSKIHVHPIWQIERIGSETENPGWKPTHWYTTNDEKASEKLWASPHTINLWVPLPRELETAQDSGLLSCFGPSAPSAIAVFLSDDIKTEAVIWITSLVVRMYFLDFLFKWKYWWCVDLSIVYGICNLTHLQWLLLWVQIFFTIILIYIQINKWRNGSHSCEFCFSLV